MEAVPVPRRHAAKPGRSKAMLMITAAELEYLVGRICIHNPHPRPLPHPLATSSEFWSGLLVLAMHEVQCHRCSDSSAESHRSERWEELRPPSLSTATRERRGRALNMCD